MPAFQPLIIIPDGFTDASQRCARYRVLGHVGTEHMIDDEGCRPRLRDHARLLVYAGADATEMIAEVMGTPGLWAAGANVREAIERVLWLGCVIIANHRAVAGDNSLRVWAEQIALSLEKDCG